MITRRNSIEEVQKYLASAPLYADGLYFRDYGFPYDKRVCYACGSKKTYVRKNGFAEWWLNLSKQGQAIGVICCKCKQSIFKIEEKKRLYTAYHQRQIYFKTKSIAIDYIPKIGVCNWCRAVYPFDTKLTHIHHESYHEDDPMKDTIELCVSCHRKETIRRGNMQILRDKKTGRIIKPVYTT